MRPARLMTPLRAATAAAALLLVPAQAASAAPAPPAAASEARTEVTVSAVDLDGPAISTVQVTVKNSAPQRLRSLKVAFAGPVGWAVQPSVQSVSGSLATGASASATFRIQVPEKRSGFVIRTFTATATYQGGDGLGTATGTRTERSGSPQANLAAAYNGVAITDESAPTAGNYDGEGNTFSAQKLASAGLTPGAKVDALGATLTWPDVPAGTKDNVSSSGQAVSLAGKGSGLVFLGSGVGSGATGTATVFYTDGTSASGSFGFPNWSFDPADAHGATLVRSTDGRNRPDGYGNATVKYRVFANSVPLDPSRTVDFVVLPANANVHVFDMAIAP
ncbi:NEW3 domain-containing protein [Streptomyces sp. NBC_01257]|uniref:NEW3 domain-containing protein n=1 Tax=Streptomyces sp. NBC_01257 TaxID=2903799 RepID=UPI002DDB354F|nr:NEW3 domain-containing protein [Streptomyces sp. NBC_01257]WRZ69246.1 NEW3 domain-containing protein [Streptomyces sp. NBC_01257]